MAHDPQSEILPPIPGTTAVQEYAPAETPERRLREFSEWDPRSAPGTYFLLAINIAVFLWMTFHGVSLREPTPDQLIHYGANNASLVIDHGQWYRLLTSTFVHIGLFHIASNMWCLWNLGLLGEPLIGPFGLVAVYILTGVAGNLLSLAVDVFYLHVFDATAQYTIGVGAGASGAVFGIAGILIVLLSNRRLPIPWSELKRLRTSVIRFAAINLVIGVSTMTPLLGSFVRIDNAAHIGGFVSGLALGPGLVPRMTAGRQKYLSRQKIVFAAAAFLLSLLGWWVTNLR